VRLQDYYELLEEHEAMQKIVLIFLSLSVDVVNHKDWLHTVGNPHLEVMFRCRVLSGILDGFGGLVVSMLASGTQGRGFKRKNRQHAFLRRGSKRICPMSQLCGMRKNLIVHVNYWTTS
jgi:hypothetical protein